jgi:hypothetical protein
MNGNVKVNDEGTVVLTPLGYKVELSKLFDWAWAGWSVGGYLNMHLKTLLHWLAHNYTIILQYNSFV